MIAKHPAKTRDDARRWACYYAADHEVMSAPIVDGAVRVVYFEAPPERWGWFGCDKFAT